MTHALRIVLLASGLALLVSCGARSGLLVCGVEPSLVNTTAPRQLLPWSDGTVTTQAPRFRWVLPPSAQGGRVEICRDPHCERIEIAVDADGDTVVLPQRLNAGVWFWRVRDRVDGVAGCRVSVIWEFTVRARDTPVNTSWGGVLDVDRDGLADTFVGAPGAPGGGRAYLYRGAHGGIAAQPTVALSRPRPSESRFGFLVVRAGDVNGDGYGDVIVGGAANPMIDSWTMDLDVFLGSADGLGSQPPQVLRIPTGPVTIGRDTFRRIAADVESAGDVNGDGYGDVVVGTLLLLAAGGFFTPLIVRGPSYVFLGSSAGLQAAPSVELATEFSASGCPMFLCTRTAIAGGADFNGDGFADVAVTASTTAMGSEVHVYLGGPNGIQAAPSIVLTAPDGVRSAWFGETLANVGDLDGDGYPELMVVARPEGTLAGVGLIARGGPRGFATGYTPVPSMAGSTALFAFAAGDVNADGFADVVIKSLYSDDDAVVYFGGTAGLSADAMTVLHRAGPTAAYCCSVSIPGDLDGDGFDDVLVGAGTFMRIDPRTYVFAGNVSGIAATPSTVLDAPDGSGSEFGSALALADGARRPHPTGASIGTESLSGRNNAAKEQGALGAGNRI